MSWFLGKSRNMQQVQESGDRVLARSSELLAKAEEDNLQAKAEVTAALQRRMREQRIQKKILEQVIIRQRRMQ